MLSLATGIVIQRGDHLSSSKFHPKSEGEGILGSAKVGGVGSRENWLKSIFLFCFWRLNVVVRFELMLESRIGHLN